MEKVMTYFSKNLRERRAGLRVSQESLATKVGMTANQIGKYENGEAVPRFDSVIRIAEALNTTPDELCSFSKLVGDTRETT